MDRESQNSEVARRVIDACLAMGFARAGIALARPTDRRPEFLRWLASGQHGEMRYLEELLDERMDVSVLLPGARSVIIVADQYASGANTDESALPKPPGHAVIARYARGRDYHRVIKSRLHALADALARQHPDAEFRSFVDTGPVLEREQAERALGPVSGAFIGKHTLLIDPELGSYLLLGGIATTLDIPPAPASPPHAQHTDHCGSCTKCIDACPTGAISPHSVDARRCISYLTLEHQTRIDPQYFVAIGDRLIGCDVCQDVCPFNAPHITHDARADRTRTAYVDESRRSFDIAHVLNWTEQDRTASLADSAAKRASLSMIRRNAVIVAGNAGLTALIEPIASNPSEDPLVRATAIDVLSTPREGSRERRAPQR